MFTEAYNAVYDVFNRVIWGNSLISFSLGLLLGYSFLQVIKGVIEKGFKGYNKSVLKDFVSDDSDALIKSEHCLLYLTILMALIYIIGFYADVILYLLMRG